MLFNSFSYLIFFPVVVMLYFGLPHRHRWILLLTAGCYFYMSFIPAYILILLTTITVDYFSGILIEQSSGAKRRLFLWLSILTNGGMLFFFKYFNFFNSAFASLASQLGISYTAPNLSLLLPIGLSFHTFQSLAYVIEVYRGHWKAERRYGILACYVLFFPQLVAGPIERPERLLPQFDCHHSFNYDRAVSGLLLIVWGLFKKVVIADRLALVVDRVYNEPTEFQGAALMAATVFFAFQIYCDFSGYTDIAIGSARILGFTLIENFRRPYFARSVSDFWKRWHISLSTWFRDYLYIPLGGRFATPLRWGFNILIVFVVSGLWHGANWTFIFWGALHGGAMILSRISQPVRNEVVRLTGLTRIPKIHHLLQVATTFSLVSFFWIPFRADKLQDAVYIMTHLFSDIHFLPLVRIGISSLALWLLAGLVGFLLISEGVARAPDLVQKLRNRPFFQRWAFYYASVMAILLLGRFDASPFIYFQF